MSDVFQFKEEEEEEVKKITKGIWSCKVIMFRNYNNTSIITTVLSFGSFFLLLRESGCGTAIDQLWLISWMIKYLQVVFFFFFFKSLLTLRQQCQSVKSVASAILWLGLKHLNK